MPTTFDLAHWEKEIETLANTWIADTIYQVQTEDIVAYLLAKETYLHFVDLKTSRSAGGRPRSDFANNMGALPLTYQVQSQEEMKAQKVVTDFAKGFDSDKTVKSSLNEFRLQRFGIKQNDIDKTEQLYIELIAILSDEKLDLEKLLEKLLDKLQTNGDTMGYIKDNDLSVLTLVWETPGGKNKVSTYQFELNT